MIKFQLFSLKASDVQNGRIRFDMYICNKRIAGLIGLRKKQYRFGFDGGDTFKQAHLGKITVGLEKRKPLRQLWNWV